jgi:hypothetical protein
VEDASWVNVDSAIKAWANRGNEHADNLMLFYFCGHGISAGTDTALLLSDYGAPDVNVLRGAIDFRSLRLGMRCYRATEQCFFVDACRASTDTVVRAESAGQVVLLPGLRDPDWPRLRAPVFYSSLKGDKAYARPNEPSVFTEALLASLEHFGGDNEEDEDDWRINTVRVYEAVEHLVARRMREFQKVQIPTADDISKVYLHYLSAPPEALVYVRSNLSEALQGATLAYRIAGGEPVVLLNEGGNAAEWEAHVPSGFWNFTLCLPSGQSLDLNNRDIRPVYRSLNFRAAQ